MHAYTLSLLESIHVDIIRTHSLSIPRIRHLHGRNTHSGRSLWHIVRIARGKNHTESKN
jgi:hypothetical protein